MARAPYEKSSAYRRYQLQWKPTFTMTDNGQAKHRTYILGEKKKLVDAWENPTTLHPVDNTTLPFGEIVRVAYNSTLILPFNTSVAMAQEYSPGVKNKIVTYNTLGGNTVTTFGQAIKRIGLRIKIIKAGDNWKVYYNGLEAMAYLSANQGRFFGNLFLIGYDSFADVVGGKSELAIPSRYKVVVESLDFSQRAETNTTVSADLQMIVTHDYSATRSNKSEIWGSL